MPDDRAFSEPSLPHSGNTPPVIDHTSTALRPPRRTIPTDSSPRVEQNKNMVRSSEQNPLRRRTRRPSPAHVSITRTYCQVYRTLVVAILGFTPRPRRFAVSSELLHAKDRKAPLQSPGSRSLCRDGDSAPGKNRLTAVPQLRQLAWHAPEIMTTGSATLRTVAVSTAPHPRYPPPRQADQQFAAPSRTTSSSREQTPPEPSPNHPWNATRPTSTLSGSDLVPASCQIPSRRQ